MHRMTLALILSLAPLAVHAEGWTLTGPRGGTTTGSGSCMMADATLTCTRQAVIVTPKGRTADREALRVTDRDGTVKTFTTTGANGRSVTTTRTRIRND